jgi:uncharacterized protein (TIGR03435 family)
LNGQNVTAPEAAPGARCHDGEFASVLQDLLDPPVIDKTGLTKRYDFDLEFSPEGTLLAPPGGVSVPIDSPDVFTAIQRLGLNPEHANGQVEVIVIDHAETPGEN